MEPERIGLSARERERLKALHEVEQGHLKQIEAARRLRLTDRHVRRLQMQLRQEGDRRIVHRLRRRWDLNPRPPSPKTFEHRRARSAAEVALCRAT